MSDAPAGRWLPIQEATVHFDKSERTLYRWADAGKIQTKLEDNRTYVFVPAPEPAPEEGPPDIDKLQTQLDLLQTKFDLLSERLTDMKSERDKWAAVVKGLADTVQKQQTLLLAATTQPADWVDVKAEPAPPVEQDQVVDVEPEPPPIVVETVKEDATPAPPAPAKAEEEPAAQKQDQAEDWRKLPWWQRLFPK